MNKEHITAKKSKHMNIKEGDMLFVRPSANNMHTFVAKENSCFFDIMLPNYSPQETLRKITYFKEIGANQKKNAQGGLTKIEYDTTPELGLPEGYNVSNVDFRGNYL